MENAVHSQRDKVLASPVEDLLAPIGNNGVGEDPCYSDNFIAVKQEIDRLSDTDYVAVVSLCREILQVEAKDLRVAGYYLLSKVFTEGIAGLIEGVEAYLGLLRRYGDACHPQRAIAKIQSIVWLNNDKLKVFVNKIVLLNNEERRYVLQLQKMISEVNATLDNLYGEESTAWTSLNAWVKNNSPSVASSGENAPDNGLASLQKEIPVPNKIDNELSFIRSVNNILDYLSSKGDVVRKIAISRALKWSDSITPDNVNGLTKIEPPRPEVVTTVESVTDFSNELLIKLESYFMEPGCHFYLDLQVKEIEMAKANGRKDIARVIESSLRQFTNQFPGIIHLTYSDGKPFAGEMTNRWLMQKEDENSENAPARNDPSNCDLESDLKQIVDQAKEIGLRASIERISQITVYDQSHSFRIDLAKINVCINCGRPDMALPLATKLEDKIDRYRLAEWDKDLTLTLWERLIKIMKSIDDSSQSKKAEIDILRGKICAMDIGFAIKMF